jgi:integrase
MALYMRGGEIDGRTGKRKGGIWWYDFWRDNKRYVESTKRRTLREAQDVERKAKNAVDDGTYVSAIKGKVTFADYVPRVMEYVRLRHPDKPRTVEFYENNYNQILKDKKFGQLRLVEINESHLTDFAIGEKKRGRMEATVNRRLASIRKLLRLALREKLITSVPHIELLRGERKREYVIVGKERDTFLAGLREPVRSIADFLFETGLRVSEATALTWSDVIEDSRGTYIRVNRVVAKSKKERHVPLSERAATIVAFQRSQSKSQFVFVRYGDKVKTERLFKTPLSRHTVSEQFTARKTQMGLPWDAVLHCTRHSALTELGASGASAFTIMRVAGHANVTTSQRYVHPIADEIRDAFERKAVYQEVVREKEAEKMKAVSVGSIQ